MKNIIERVVKTFLETAVAYTMAAVGGINFLAEKSTLKTVLTGVAISAVAAGLSAVWNGVISPLLREYKDDTKFEEVDTDDILTEAEESEG